MLFLIMLIYYLKIEHLKAASLGADHIRYSLPISQVPQNGNQMILLIPEGLTPPKPPTERHMYPFEKGLEEDTSSSDWRPIIPRPWLKPVMEDRVKPKKVQTYSNHRYESMAFGPWQPVSPLFMAQLPTNFKKEDQKEYENVTPAEKRTYVLIGGRSRTKNHTKYYPKSTIVNQTIGLQLNKKNIIEITTVTEDYHKSLSPPSTETATTTLNNVWPKDFIVTSEKPQDDELLHNSLINITKLGVPFENRKTSDKASICVPLTVQAQKSATDIVEIDRIYCFPLPAAAENSNSSISQKTTYSTTDSTILYATIDSAAEILKLKYFLLFISLCSIIILY